MEEALGYCRSFDGGPAAGARAAASPTAAATVAGVVGGWRKPLAIPWPSGVKRNPGRPGISPPPPPAIMPIASWASAFCCCGWLLRPCALPCWAIAVWVLRHGSWFLKESASQMLAKEEEEEGGMQGEGWRGGERGGRRRGRGRKGRWSGMGGGWREGDWARSLAELLHIYCWPIPQGRSFA